MPHFFAPKKIVELKLIVVNQRGERETVSCELDNRQRPCVFTARYSNGKLECGACSDYLD